MNWKSCKEPELVVSTLSDNIQNKTATITETDRLRKIITIDDTYSII